MAMTAPKANTDTVHFETALHVENKLVILLISLKLTEQQQAKTSSPHKTENCRAQAKITFCLWISNSATAKANLHLINC